MAILLLGGSIASVLSLAGRIGRRCQAQGSIAAISTPAHDITEFTCHLDPAWRGHRGGQFAFVTFSTIVSKDEAFAAENLIVEGPATAGAEVWFCGPADLGQTNEKRLRAVPFRLSRFHKEAFQFR
jgi:predicted ferric reductase